MRVCENVLLSWRTYSSVVSLGRPLGRVVRPLLLQRTTVSRQEHSAGHLSTGEQLFSSLPDECRWMDDGEMRDNMKRQHEIKKKKCQGYQSLWRTGSVECKSAPSHRLHRQSPGRLHPGWGSPSGSKDSDSGGYRWRCAFVSASRPAMPGDSYSWKDWPEGCYKPEGAVGNSDRFFRHVC